jgi:ribosomal protein L37AE/L43A
MSLKEEVWYCSHCGHEVNASDEFCVACESIFAGTEMAARSRLANRIEENKDGVKLSAPAEHLT